MISRPYNKLLWLGLGAASYVVAEDLRYVTDLDIFTSLAGCAGDVLSYVVMAQTYSNCPEGVTELQSCACTKDSNSASLTAALSSSVSLGCGGTATDDQASVETVFSAYCHQDSTVNFPTLTSPVSLYITDFPAWNDLAPCAADGISYQLQSMTYESCPSDPEDLATCACQKNQNSLALSKGINTGVDFACSSNDADRSSAQAVFAAYCNLNDGTSKFPTTSDPPGDMTYYVTALEEFNSLAPCAQSAVSYGIQAQTYDACPSGPQALASCACIKEDVSVAISQSITSIVGFGCGDTASEDVTSALAVYEQYCSAAQGKVTPTVAESISQPPQTLSPGGGSGGGLDFPTETGFTFLSTPTWPSATSTGEARNPFDDLPGTGDSGSGSGNGKSKGGTAKMIGAIVGGVVGGIAFLVLVGLAIFFGWWRGREMGRRAGSGGADSSSSGAAGVAGGAVAGGGGGGLGGGAAAAAGEKVNVEEQNRPVSPVSSTTAAGTVSAIGVHGTGGHGDAGRVSPIQQDDGKTMGELPGQYAFAPGAVVGAKELDGKQGSISRKPVGMGGKDYVVQNPHSPREADGKAIGQVQRYEVAGDGSPRVVEPLGLAYGGPQQQYQQQQRSEVDGDGTLTVEAGGYSRSELPGGDGDGSRLGGWQPAQQQQQPPQQQYEADDGTPRVEAGGNSRSELPGADSNWQQQHQQQQQEYEQQMRQQQMQQYQKYQQQQQQQSGQGGMMATAGPGMTWDGGYKG